MQRIFSGRAHCAGLSLAGLLYHSGRKQDYRRRNSCPKVCFSTENIEIIQMMKKLLPVDDDYLLLDYYYFVVWRASCTKRVKRDYFYLDYSFLGSARLLVLTGMRLSRRAVTWKFQPEI